MQSTKAGRLVEDEEASRVVTGYLEGLSGVWLAENVTVTDACAGRTYSGRADAAEWFRQTGLASAPVRDLRLMASGGQVAAEWHIEVGDRSVCVAGFAVVEAGEIASLRVYARLV